MRRDESLFRMSSSSTVVSSLSPPVGLEHTCTICNKSYKNADSLRKHVKRGNHTFHEDALQEKFQVANLQPLGSVRFFHDMHNNVYLSFQS